MKKWILTCVLFSAGLLASPLRGSDLFMKVHAQQTTLNVTSQVSLTPLSNEAIGALPQGENQRLTEVLTNAAPGVIRGPFGQIFVRGNDANLQYQIDGVQLPDSISNSFGQALNLRNINKVDFITGGFSAQYGQRLSAVVNIETKTGPETPGGEIETHYGTFNSFGTSFIYGGSTTGGDFHYFFSGSQSNSDRGLDTPQPKSVSNQTQGGADAIHDKSSENNTFVKLDWILSNSDKLSLVLFDGKSTFEVPNLPASFLYTDPYFQSDFTDQFGSVGGLPFRHFSTSDTQSEQNDYAQLIWKHSFSETAFLQITPYWRYTSLNYAGDPTHNLFVVGRIPSKDASSVSEDRRVNSYGISTDFTFRASDQHLFKTGATLQYAKAEGYVSLTTDEMEGTDHDIKNFVDRNSATSVLSSLYIQDEITLSQALAVHAGLRYDSAKLTFFDTKTDDAMISPRLGVTYLYDAVTQLHAYYGRLFQPSTLENFRNTVSHVKDSVIPSYDVKPEIDDYYELGITRQVAPKQLLTFTAYYKNITNAVDLAGLLETSLIQPINWATGHAYGAELSLRGQLTPEITEYFNYTYSIAEAKGLSGGLFAVDPEDLDIDDDDYTYIDQVQFHTVNAGFTYSKDHFWSTVQGIYGSGLRTGHHNSVSLPGHFVLNTTVGYEFKGKEWWSQFRLSLDVINVFDNAYPITISNEFNGTHYEAGRQFVVRMSKTF